MSSGDCNAGQRGVELPLERSYQSAQLAKPLSWLLDGADSATVVVAE